MNLQDNIKNCRKAMGFTQEQLAEAMGVTVGAVSKWESGQSLPDLNRQNRSPRRRPPCLIAIAKCFP